MMSAQKFLKDKGILKEGYTQWIIRFDDNREFDIVKLLDEFTKDKYSREEVRELLKLQIKKVRNTIGRMPGEADDIAILKKISSCKLITFKK